ncbi:MAG: hypothetical protein IPL87_03295 [Candidatus Moraniibacteriota bacterium]|nr:MAG: hypothetical protein IPL87_03295 [Candidatus Moranbacteria bacterium]
MLVDDFGEHRRSILTEYVSLLLKSGKQVLFLTSNPATLLQERYWYHAAGITQGIAVYLPGMSEKELRHVRESVRCGETRFVLGTEGALFLPFRSLDVIVDNRGGDAGSFGPILPISTAVVLDVFRQIFKVSLVRVSSTPSFSEIFEAKSNKNFVALSQKKHPKQRKWEIVNLRLERWKKNRSPFSEILRTLLCTTLAEKRQAILVVGRSGMSAFSFCAGCKTLLRCSDCGKILSYEKSGEYICNVCRKRTGATPSCASCGSLVFSQVGIGTERVERDLRRAFPESTFVRYDKNSRKRQKTFLEIDEFVHGNRDIFLTTPEGAFGWDLPRISLVAIMDADTLVGLSRWDADEFVFHLGASLVKTVGENGTALLQTFHPENPLFDFLAREDRDGFFALCTEERETLLYPPFGRITTLTCTLPSSPKLCEEVDRVLLLLQAEKHLLASRRRVVLTVSPVPRKRYGRKFEKDIVIREEYSSTHRKRMREKATSSTHLFSKKYFNHSLHVGGLTDRHNDLHRSSF